MHQARGEKKFVQNKKSSFHNSTN